MKASRVLVHLIFPALCGLGIAFASVRAAADCIPDSFSHSLDGAGQFGASVATDGQTTLVGAPGAGLVRVHDAHTGALLGTIQNPAPDGFDEFGASVAVSGIYAVVGAPYDETSGFIFGGAAYVFNTLTQKLLSTLIDPHPGTLNNFGWSVGVSGNTVVVGSPGDSNDFGKAYVFNGSTGALIRTLGNPSVVNRLFGWSVAIEGNQAAIGAPLAETQFQRPYVYVMDATTGASIAQIITPASSNDKDNSFGQSVAISGGRVIAGAPTSNIGGVAKGIAYVFNSTAGNLIATLTAPGGEANDRFGNSVSIRGNLALVGSNPDTPENESEAAWLYDSATGALAGTIAGSTLGESVALAPGLAVVGFPGGNRVANHTCCVPDTAAGVIANPDPDVEDKFGEAVAVSGASAIIGAPSDDNGGNNSGTAYITNLTSGFVSTVAHPFPAEGDNFGSSVAISGTRSVVGAPYKDIGGNPDVGAAYVFSFSFHAATLNAPNPSAGQNFASKVAISGAKVVASEASFAGYEGRAHLFDASTGALIMSIPNPDPSAGDAFSATLAFDGAVIAISAMGDDQAGAEAGAIYIYSDAGAFIRKIVNPSPLQNAVFGVALAVSGGKVLASGYGLSYVFDAATGALLATHPGNDRLALSQSYALVGLDLFSAHTGELLGTIDGTGIANVSIQARALGGDFALIGGAQGGGFGEGVVHRFSCPSDPISEPVPACLVSANAIAIPNPTPVTDDRFGASLAISGENAIVGVPRADAGAMNSGSAYVLQARTGAFIQRIDNPSPGVNDNFGVAVAGNENYIVIGADSDDNSGTDAGSIYVHGKGLFTTPAPAAGSRYGAALSISGSRVVVGAPGYASTGRAYVIDASSANGTLVSTLMNPSPDGPDQFGISVSIDGDLVAVGASSDNSLATGAGMAYVFRASTGQQIMTLVDRFPAAEDHLGISVSISGNRVLVGASGENVGGPYAGAAYLFDVTTGALLRVLSNPTPAQLDEFGQVVALQGNLAVVTGVLDEGGATDSGLAYLFDVRSQSMVRSYQSLAPGAFGIFGSSVALSGDMVLIGESFGDLGVSNAGAAYSFSCQTASPTPTPSPTSSPSPSPTPYVGRPFGDFDNSGCTDLQDFLFLLDNWNIEVDGTEMGLGDFLALLDNWLAGPNC